MSSPRDGVRETPCMLVPVTEIDSNLVLRGADIREDQNHGVVV